MMHPFTRCGLSGGFFWFVVLLLVPTASVSAATELIYGPAVYQRGDGQPETFIDTFQPARLDGTFTLVVENGDQQTVAQRVTSAVVGLNGAHVLRPNDFKKKVSRLEKTVVLEATNELTVQVRGEPGTYVTVSIIADYPNRTPLAN